MRQQPKYASADLSSTSYKIKLYLQKLTDETLSHSKLEKLSHLAIESLLKFNDAQQFMKENYDRIKTFTNQKKSYYGLYIIDIMLKNNRFFFALVKKDIRDIEGSFKSIWHKIFSQNRKDSRLQDLKCMVKTWGVLYSKKEKGAIQQSIKKWLTQKYNTNMNLPDELKLAFEESYQKQNSTLNPKYEQLLMQMKNEESTKKLDFSGIDPRIFDD